MYDSAVTVIYILQRICLEGWELPLETDNLLKDLCKARLIIIVRSQIVDQKCEIATSSRCCRCYDCYKPCGEKSTGILLGLQRQIIITPSVKLMSSIQPNSNKRKVILTDPVKILWLIQHEDASTATYVSCVDQVRLFISACHLQSQTVTITAGFAHQVA